MEDSFENMDELIAKVLVGEASQEEIRVLDNWRNASVENEGYFSFSKKLFDAMAVSQEETVVNTDAAWQKLDARITAPPQEAKVVPLQRRLVLMRVAAAAALVIGLGFLAKWMLTENTVQPLMVAANTHTVKQTLPDGSQVFLNKHAELSYVVNKDNVREVKLKGEAFFEVVHNPEQPFIITVDEVTIKDIGTAFNVKAIPGSAIVEVSVESGEVEFSAKNKSAITLVKGEKAVYDRNSGQFTKHAEEQTENTNSYRTRLFAFKGTPLKEVIRQVNEVYESDIRLSDEMLGNCTLSVEFTDEKLDIIVTVIAETLDLETERNGNTIILKGEACTQ